MIIISVINGVMDPHTFTPKKTSLDVHHLWNTLHHGVVKTPLLNHDSFSSPSGVPWATYRWFSAATADGGAPHLQHQHEVGSRSQAPLRPGTSPGGMQRLPPLRPLPLPDAGATAQFSLVRPIGSHSSLPGRISTKSESLWACPQVFRVPRMNAGQVPWVSRGWHTHSHTLIRLHRASESIQWPQGPAVLSPRGPSG